MNELPFKDLLKCIADFECNPTYDTIIRWIRCYPEYADKIFKYIDCMIICKEEGENE